MLSASSPKANGPVKHTPVIYDPFLKNQQMELRTEIVKQFNLHVKMISELVVLNI